MRAHIEKTNIQYFILVHYATATKIVLK